MDEPPITNTEYWAILKARGYTPREVVSGARNIRTVLLQGTDANEILMIAHPDDLSPGRRRTELTRFLGSRLDD